MLRATHTTSSAPGTPDDCASPLVRSPGIFLGSIFTAPSSTLTRSMTAMNNKLAAAGGVGGQPNSRLVGGSRRSTATTKAAARRELFKRFIPPSNKRGEK